MTTTHLGTATATRTNSFGEAYADTVRDAIALAKDANGFEVWCRVSENDWLPIVVSKYKMIATLKMAGENAPCRAMLNERGLFILSTWR